jgi:hypothetical protein
MLVRDKAELPPLVRVTFCAVLVVPTDWLPNVRVVVERPTVPDIPVPARLTAWGLPPVALSTRLIAAVRPPEAEGVKVVLIVQLPFTASELPQVVVSAKSPALLPVTAMLVMPKLRLPVFVRVTVCAGVLGELTG